LFHIISGTYHGEKPNCRAFQKTECPLHGTAAAVGVLFSNAPTIDIPFFEMPPKLIEGKNTLYEMLLGHT
jgi:hypothetical protein